jgi:hypothetical protein
VQMHSRWISHLRSLDIFLVIYGVDFGYFATNYNL